MSRRRPAPPGRDLGTVLLRLAPGDRLIVDEPGALRAVMREYATTADTAARWLTERREDGTLDWVRLTLTEDRDMVDAVEGVGPFTVPSPTRPPPPPPYMLYVLRDHGWFRLTAARPDRGAVPVYNRVWWVERGYYAAALDEARHVHDVEQAGRAKARAEVRELLAEAVDLLQSARPDGNDPGNNRRWGRRRKTLVNAAIDLRAWPREDAR